MTADNARCTAAAEGTEGAVMTATALPFRLGLRLSTLPFRDDRSFSAVDDFAFSSTLLFRDRRPFAVLIPVIRAGDESLDILGEVLTELEANPGMREVAVRFLVTVDCDDDEAAAARPAAFMLPPAPVTLSSGPSSACSNSGLSSIPSSRAAAGSATMVEPVMD